MKRNADLYAVCAVLIAACVVGWKMVDWRFDGDVALRLPPSKVEMRARPTVTPWPASGSITLPAPLVGERMFGPGAANALFPQPKPIIYGQTPCVTGWFRAAVFDDIDECIKHRPAPTAIFDDTYIWPVKR